MDGIAVWGDAMILENVSSESSRRPETTGSPAAGLCKGKRMSISSDINNRNRFIDPLFFLGIPSCEDAKSTKKQSMSLCI
jgi:hypothetical protein